MGDEVANMKIGNVGKYEFLSVNDDATYAWDLKTIYLCVIF